MLLTNKLVIPSPGSNHGGERGSNIQASTAKQRTADWFANLFSPNKTRHDSSSTDTSKSLSLAADPESGRLGAGLVANTIALLFVKKIFD